ncbi:P-type conjugative transfer protein VirB9 [Blastomonas marina]|uniref:P-type conjugative transfer protein VirB9 n=1 Tax=Blastomonas marina TaxID=1867408 RepID=A0ABQ1FGT9_9SPHN|nr:TrbG/VirB9 family P-type conjugative transfer protein [Blastomonas marina]GGA09533.1 P-type conjugative transfer protein VirB9 [Blastomonas marina]
MMRVVAALLLALIASATDVRAQDPRLVEVFYDEDRVVRLEGRTNVQAMIVFGEDEVIENIGIGDSNSWQVTPNKGADRVFVKPLSEIASTNMTVVTSKRTYLFDLVSNPRNPPVYMLSFIYPDEAEAEETVASPAARATAAELAAASDPYAVVDPATLNTQWSRRGAAVLMPERIYNDAEATFLVWDPERAIPAILLRNDEGDEGPANYTLRGDTIVVEGVPGLIVLRSGDDLAELFYAGPPRVSAEAGSR